MSSVMMGEAELEDFVPTHGRRLHKQNAWLALMGFRGPQVLGSALAVHAQGATAISFRS